MTATRTGLGLMLSSIIALVGCTTVDPYTREEQTATATKGAAAGAVGHTDSTGSRAYNERLSEQRADAVGDYLVRRGIRPVRVEKYGMGETMPIASNDSAAGRAQNRRVELTLLPLT